MRIVLKYHRETTWDGAYWSFQVIDAAGEVRASGADSLLWLAKRKAKKRRRLISKDIEIHGVN